MKWWDVQYNGCVWKGGKLRLEKAEEHYLYQEHS
jgi:hypothetical protein